MKKITTRSNIEEKVKKSLKEIGEFSMDLNLPIPFLSELIVKSSAYIKGFFKGANYGLINSDGDSSHQQYSLFLSYYKFKKSDLRF